MLHENRLAEREEERVKSLVVNGILDAKVLKKNLKMRDDLLHGQRVAMRPEEKVVTVPCRIQFGASRDFRKFTPNPAGSKYNALSVNAENTG